MSITYIPWSTTVCFLSLFCFSSQAFHSVLYQLCSAFLPVPFYFTSSFLYSSMLWSWPWHLTIVKHSSLSDIQLPKACAEPCGCFKEMDKCSDFLTLTVVYWEVTNRVLKRKSRLRIKLLFKFMQWLRKVLEMETNYLVSPAAVFPKPSTVSFQ